MTKYRNGIAVFSGSFDPFHLGHLSVLKKANKLFKKVYVVISNNPDKNSRALIMRYYQVKYFLEKHGLDNEILINEGLTIDVAKDYGAKYLVRGLRDDYDLNFEAELAEENRLLDPEIETICFYAEPNLKKMSSKKLRKRD